MINKTYTRTLPWRCEKFPFSPSTVLAPMEGVTNCVVRDAINKIGGVGLLCTEFVRVSAHAVTEKTVKASVIKTVGTPLSVQIMGNDASLMADSAERMEQAGADVVDINLGCPTKNAVKGNVGSAMLKDPELLYTVLSSMRQKVKGLLSAKIRAGFDESEHVSTIALAVEASGADFIAVHPRRRKDFYEGRADWRIIAHLKNILKIPVVGNGDIWYPQDGLQMVRETNCDAIMIGRGALRNPWIFKQYQLLQSGIEYRPSTEEICHFFMDIKENFLEHFEGRELAVLSRLKEFMQYFSRLFEDGTEFRTNILRVTELNLFMEVLLAKIVEKSPEELDFFQGYNSL